MFDVMSSYRLNCVTEGAVGCWMFLENHVKIKRGSTRNIFENGFVLFCFC